MTESNRPDDNRFHILCRHPDYLNQRIDFSEIARGAPDQIRASGSNKWLGGFRGRPTLAKELAPAINLVAGGCKPRHAERRVTSFRGFWRMLDQLERGGLAPVETLQDISSFHGVQWLRSKNPPAYSDYASVRSILDVARDLADMQPIDWIPAKQKKPTLGDVPTPEQTHRVYLALKRRVFAVYAHWRDADLLASKGRNLLDIPKSDRLPPSQVNAADMHASYRSLIARTGNPVPSSEDLIEAMGYSPIGAGGKVRPISDVFFKARVGIRELREGIYPSLEMIQHFFYLFLIQTGWNVQVALDIDISDPRWAVKIGDPEADIYRLSSYKVRSGAWQRTICRGKPSHSPYQLICRLLDRTRDLREKIDVDQGFCANPAIARRSPWIHITDKLSLVVSILNDKSYIRQPSADGSYLTALAAEINELDLAKNLSIGSPGEGNRVPVAPVPENIKASDFRDIYIGNEFLQSGYNMVIAKLAAGHAGMGSIRRYLATRAWRRHSEGSVRRMMDHLWGEIETHRVCDPAIIRALCDRGVITDEQRERWERGKDRTYLGMGCVDPLHPPKHIDPTHELGRLCRNQQRCTLCEHGIVLPDSLSDLCKRLAELNSLETQMSLAAWNRADGLRAERDTLVKTLEQFNKDSVSAEVSRWKEDIDSGRHQPLEWSGLHGL